MKIKIQTTLKIVENSIGSTISYSYIISYQKFPHSWPQNNIVSYEKKDDEDWKSFVKAQGNVGCKKNSAWMVKEKRWQGQRHEDDCHEGLACEHQHWQREGEFNQSGIHHFVCHLLLLLADCVLTYRRHRHNESLRITRPRPKGRLTSARAALAA